MDDLEIRYCKQEAATLRRAKELLDLLASPGASSCDLGGDNRTKRLLAEAELTAAGWRYLMVANQAGSGHGIGATTGQERDRRCSLQAAFDRLRAGRPWPCRGTEHTLTMLVGPPDADAALHTLQDLANILNPGCWQITPAPVGQRLSR